MTTAYTKTLLFSTVICIAVLGSFAQIPVTVTYDPPSPVRTGNVTFRCDFTLSSGDSLVQQYWQVLGGVRFFEYTPGGSPEIRIDPDYVNKIHGYKSDDLTWQSVVFHVTPCDIEQYLCYVLASPTFEEGQAQESLDVTNVKSATLKINQTGPVEDKVIAKGDTTISCELYNAGPPLPGKLALEMNGAEVEFSTDHAQDSQTCMWNYAIPLEYIVQSEDMTTEQVLRCQVDYTDPPSVYSPEITLVPDPCNNNPCQNNGVCHSYIENDQAVFQCECPCHTSGDLCETTVCDSNPCGANGTCSFANCQPNCTCPEDVHGDYCVNDPCNSNPCQNDGICSSHIENDQAVFECDYPWQASGDL